MSASPHPLPDEPAATFPLLANPLLTLGLAAVFAALGAVASFVLPPQYQAHGKIILPNSGGRSSSLSTLANFAGVSADTGSLPMFTAILKSERMLNAVSHATNVPKKKLRKQMDVRDDSKANTVEVVATASDPDLALKIVKSGLKTLGDIAVRVNLPLRQNQTSRLATDLTGQQQTLAKNEAALQAFLQSSKTAIAGGSALAGGSSASGDAGTVGAGMSYKQQLTALQIEADNLDAQLRAIDETSKQQAAAAPLDLPPVKLWAERIAQAQANLAEVRIRYHENTPETRGAEKALRDVLELRKHDVDQYLASVRASLTGTTQSLSTQRQGVASQIAAVQKYVDAAPNETIQYLRLLRNVGESEAIVREIRLQYERAREEQGNDPNNWSVLDLPEIDDTNDPRRTSRDAMMGGLAGLALAYAIAVRRKR